jgi:hypothetical protein
VRWLPLLLIFGCTPGVLPEDLVVPPADDDDDEGLPVMPPVDTAECGFEDGDLAGFGHPGESWVVYDEQSTQIGVVGEGDSFSAFYGEEFLEFPGEHALLMRIAELPPPFGYAYVRTNPFVPQGRWFHLAQLNEVGGHGIALSLSIQDEFGDELEVRDLKVHTGGFVPQLLEHHGELPEFPEIGRKSFQPGEFVRTWIDLDPYDTWEEPLVLEFRQQSKHQQYGFFTLLDNLCHGEPVDPPDL